MTAAPDAAEVARAREALEAELAKWDADKARGFVGMAFLVRPDHARTILAALRRCDEAVAAENEACAAIVDACECDWGGCDCTATAARIRARRQEDGR